MRIFCILVALILVSACDPVYADIRCCVQPERYANGKIKRSKAVIREFERLSVPVQNAKTAGNEKFTRGKK